MLPSDIGPVCWRCRSNPLIKILSSVYGHVEAWSEKSQHDENNNTYTKKLRECESAPANLGLLHWYGLCIITHTSNDKAQPQPPASSRVAVGCSAGLDSLFLLCKVFQSALEGTQQTFGNKNRINERTKTGGNMTVKLR